MVPLLCISAFEVTEVSAFLFGLSKQVLTEVFKASKFQTSRAKDSKERGGPRRKCGSPKVAAKCTDSVYRPACAFT